MNKVILMGRLVRDPEVRYSQGAESTTIARYTLAVDRKYAQKGETNADFIPCIAFGRAADFAEKYLHKGTKIVITGHIRTGSYTNRDGNRVYTTDVIIEEQEFAESKNKSDDGSSASQSSHGSSPKGPYPTSSDGFIDMDSIDEELPFN